jgi:hypothetical protein
MISASLSGWSGDPSNNTLGLYLYDSTGLLASATAPVRPQTLTYVAASRGTYSLQVVAIKGGGTFVLTVTGGLTRLG